MKHSLAPFKLRKTSFGYGIFSKSRPTAIASVHFSSDREELSANAALFVNAADLLASLDALVAHIYQGGISEYMNEASVAAKDFNEAVKQAEAVIDRASNYRQIGFSNGKKET